MCNNLVEGDALFPSRGFFNEVSLIKGKTSLRKRSALIFSLYLSLFEDYVMRRPGHGVAKKEGVAEAMASPRKKASPRSWRRPERRRHLDKGVALSRRRPSEDMHRWKNETKGKRAVHEAYAK